VVQLYERKIERKRIQVNLKKAFGLSKADIALRNRVAGWFVSKIPIWVNIVGRFENVYMIYFMAV
jgi:hypothetical protein